MAATSYHSLSKTSARAMLAEIFDVDVNDGGFPDIALSPADRDFVANARTDIEVLLALVDHGGR